MDKLRHIHSKIGTETAYRIPVSVEGAIAEAVAAYDQMAARIERLEQLHDNAAILGFYTVSFDSGTSHKELCKLAFEARAESPAASLLLHDAAVLEKLADDWANECSTEFTGLEVAKDLRADASELCKQAAALEGEG